MNTLLAEIIRSLKELQLGFAGELTMSDAMENLMDALFLDKVRGRTKDVQAAFRLNKLSGNIH